MWHGMPTARGILDSDSPTPYISSASSFSSLPTTQALCRAMIGIAYSPLAGLFGLPFPRQASAAQRRAATLRLLPRCGPARSSLCGRSSESLSPSPPSGLRHRSSPLLLPVARCKPARFGLISVTPSYVCMVFPTYRHSESRLGASSASRSSRNGLSRGGPARHKPPSIHSTRCGNECVGFFLASDQRTLTSSNFARCPVEFGYSRYLFHDPCALGAFTLIFFVSHAVRAPALAWHRRVRRAGPTRLTDSRPLLHPCSSLRADSRSTDNITPWRPSSLGAIASSRFGVPLWILRRLYLVDSACRYSFLYLSVLLHLPFLCEHRSGYLRSRAVLCNELSRGGLSRGGRPRHKTDVDPFVLAANIECDSLVSRCSRRATA
jgi:hypothetical protein